jgi:hypothetical protein
MHQLNEQATADFVNRIGNFAPPSDMARSVDAGGVEITLPIFGWLSALGDKQTKGGALGVIFGGNLGWRAIRVSAATGHGSHNETVRK